MRYEWSNRCAPKPPVPLTRRTGRAYPPRALNLFDRVCGLSKQVIVTQKQDWGV